MAQYFIFWHRWYRKFSKRTLHLAINKNWAVASPFIHKNGPLTRSEGDKPIICARATSEPVTWHIYYKLLHLTADICLLNPAVCRSISQTQRTTWKWMQIPQTIFYHLFIADWFMHVLLHWKKTKQKKSWSLLQLIHDQAEVQFSKNWVIANKFKVSIGFSNVRLIKLPAHETTLLS